LLRARQERLVEGGLGLGFTLQFAQVNQRFIVGEDGGALLGRVIGESGQCGPCLIEPRFRDRLQAGVFGRKLAFEHLCLGLELGNGGMARAIDDGLHLQLLLDLRIFRLQPYQRRRAGRLVAGHDATRDQLIVGRFFRDQRSLRLDHLIVEQVERRLARQIADAQLQALLALIVLHALLGQIDGVLEFEQTVLKAIHRTIGALRLRLCELLAKGVDHCRRDFDRFVGILRGDGQGGDEGALIALHLHAFAQARDGDRRRIGLAVARDEFGVVNKIQRFDDPCQHVARTQDPQLAARGEQLCIGLARIVVEILVDDPQTGRVDQDLGGDGIARLDENRDRASGQHANQCKSGDCDPALPNPSVEVLQVEGEERTAALECRLLGACGERVVLLGDRSARKSPIEQGSILPVSACLVTAGMAAVRYATHLFKTSTRTFICLNAKRALRHSYMGGFR